MYAAQPLIDFHVNNSSDDYNYRILASNGENMLLFQGRKGANVDEFRFLGDVNLPYSSMRVGGHITCDMNVTANTAYLTGDVYSRNQLVCKSVNSDTAHRIDFTWKLISGNKSGLYAIIDGQTINTPLVTHDGQ